MISLILLIFLNVPYVDLGSVDFSPERIAHYREKVKAMFYHAYDGYLNYAFPYDELKPITCAGMDTWGSFSLTLVDALDTLIIMGNYSEFERASKIVQKSINFDANVNVSVFETNIRVIGGLLSAHMLSGLAGVELDDGWPCSGPLLSLAERMASKLLPAFNSYTGMPYGTVNLRYGVHRHETPITCTAGVGTFLLEFASLSRLTGSPVYERVARKAMDDLWKHRSSIGLVGNHINVQTGAWTATDAGIGAGVDSYFEYLAKSAILFDNPELMRQFKEYKNSIEKYLRKNDWFMWVSMSQGQVTMPIFQSLEAFWPGVLTLVGDVDSAMRIILNYQQIQRQYGFMPEFYNIPTSEFVNKRSGYPLRPELAESLMYLYRATEDPILLQMGAELVDAIEHSAKTKCGYATVYDVNDHVIEDRMESFFLSETTKYLYLLFDPDNFIHNDGTHGVVVDTTNGKCVLHSGGYVFNTEAHPLDPSVLYCCDRRRRRHQEILSDFHDNMDLLSVLGLNDAVAETQFGFTREEFVEEIADANDVRTPSTLATNADIGYELEHEKTPVDITRLEPAPEEHEDPEEYAAPSSVVEANAEIPRKTKNKVLTPPEKRSSTTSKFNFADTVIKALAKVVDEWKVLLDADKQIETLEQLDSNGYCKRDEQTTSSQTLNAMLNVVYSRRPNFGAHAASNFLCDPADAPKEEEHYLRGVPDWENATMYGTGDEEDERWSVGDLSLRTYFDFASISTYHFELMSCKARPFTSRLTGLGEVVGESEL